ncbi:MAG: methyltransferase [Burkholderiaceae bacterium]|jgi:predicted methyltransferase|nr:methyltransferase [Burkholderiaceae bacterium]
MRAHKIVFAAVALTAACLSAPCPAAEVPQAVAATVADSARPAADTARDANRKPAQTLAFADIKPGAKIAELMPGGGYYTRLLSKLAGPGGHVYALYPPRRPNAPDLEAAGKAIAADPHYGNVTVLPLSYTDRALDLPQPVDVAWTSDNYHDIHNILTSAEMQDFNRRVFEALKPGGMYIVLDHAAAAGHGASDTKTMHRIDPETVKAEVTAAGFKLAGSSDALRNPDDPHTAPIFDASVRGRTDQFILKFVKP